MRRFDEERDAERPGPPLTLGVDVGGTYVKASVLDSRGQPVAEHTRLPTPKPATPQAVLDTIARLAGQLPSFHRIAVGFPGIVRGGTVVTAPNLATEHWAGFELIDALMRRFGAPARMLNDAAVQGLGAVEGHGLECVITLGTGVGCALFRNRRLLLHLELGQHACADLTYDQMIGQAALDVIGLQAWNIRVHHLIKTVGDLTCCDVLYVGGGNARKIICSLPPFVKIVDDASGVTGGVRLWEPELDELFDNPPNARDRAEPKRSG